MVSSRSLGIVSRPGHVESFGREVHRAQLDVRLHEPAIQIHGDLQTVRQFRRAFRRHQGILRTRQSGCRRISRPSSGSQMPAPAALRRAVAAIQRRNLRLVLRVIADENDPQAARFGIQPLLEAIGPNVLI